MRIQVQGKQIDVGHALTEHVTQHLSAAVEKYFHRPVEAIVTSSRDARAFRCDALVHLPTGLTAASSAVATDVYAAFEQGAERIESRSGATSAGCATIIRIGASRLKRSRQRHMSSMPEPAGTSRTSPTPSSR